mmetsp:Transcript_16369/g.39981  ORF Transcript_16369/g.39981 Transcript_16369/m.39981 type:complete len:115 (-) Transcript_16369:700-1044(-)
MNPRGQVVEILLSALTSRINCIDKGAKKSLRDEGDVQIQEREELLNRLCICSGSTGTNTHTTSKYRNYEALLSFQRGILLLFFGSAICVIQIYNYGTRGSRAITLLMVSSFSSP